MSSVTWILLLVPLTATALAQSESKPDSAPSPLRARHWIEDIDHLAATLPSRHPAPFITCTRAEFDQRLAKLREAVPTLDDDGVEVRLRAAVAALGDGHTALATPDLARDALPIRFYQWSDGIRVFAIPPAEANCAGAALLSVDGHPLSEVLPALASVDSADSPPRRQATLPHLIAQARLLHALGLVKDPAKVSFSVRRVDGQAADFVLTPGQLGRDAVYARPAHRVVTDQHGDRWHHQEVVDGHILYIQFNQCATSKEHDLDRFGATVEGVLQGGKITAVVFDLQYNGGGNSALGDALFARLARFAPMRDRKNVFCVIGPYTFSSGILNAVTLKKVYGAVFVGAPTGQGPDHCGEVRSFRLPRSNLLVSHSTKVFNCGSGHERSIIPDHLATRSFADYQAGRDPVMEMVQSLLR